MGQDPAAPQLLTNQNGFQNSSKTQKGWGGWERKRESGTPHLARKLVKPLRIIKGSLEWGVGVPEGSLTILGTPGFLGQGDDAWTIDLKPLTPAAQTDGSAGPREPRKANPEPQLSARGIRGGGEGGRLMRDCTRRRDHGASH